MEIDVAWPGAGTGRHARGLDQHAAPGIEAIGDDAVAALARHVEEAALADRAGCRADTCCAAGSVRAELARHARSASGRAAGCRRRRPAARRPNRWCSWQIARIAAGRVEGEMHRIVAAGRLPIEKRELAASCRSMAKDVASRAIAVHGVEVRAVRARAPGMTGSPAAEMLDVREGAGAAVDAINVDAVAAAVALGRGVAADIGEERAIGAAGVFHAPSVPSARGRDNRPHAQDDQPDSQNFAPADRLAKYPE